MASLILLIGVTGVYFMLQHGSDTEPVKKYKLPSEEDLKKTREARKPPPGASPNGHSDKVQDKTTQPLTPTDVVEIKKPQSKDVVKTFSGRVGSDYPLLIETENPVIGKPIYLRTVDGTGIDIEWESLSPAELAEKIKLAERRQLLPLERQEEGYYYKHSEEGVDLDERGFPILHKQNEPSLTLFWEIKFKPSREQLEEYRELYRRRNRISVRTPSSPEIAAINAELSEMERTITGPVPLVNGILVAAPSDQYDAIQAHGFQLAGELQKEIFRLLDLEHLIGFY